ncbi:MAG: hypothetical protein GY737_23955 [Desulfobacteraceae bacterium]|nr:hypothetical protein [Desulfobacteraceae bacterium]
MVVLLVIASIQPGRSDILESVNFASRWPDTSPRNIATGSSGTILYYTGGNQLTLINPDTLAELSRIELEVTRGLVGVCADPSGEIVYVACGSKGLALVDVSKPSAPVLLKKLQIDPDKEQIHATAIDYLDNRVYIADVYFGLRIIDVSNPLNPNQSGTYEQSSEYTDSEGQVSSYSGGHINLRVAEINNRKYAFVLDKYYGLRIFDVTIDSAPQLVDQYEMRTKILYGQLALVVDIEADQNYAYVSDATNGITILNLFSDPDRPDTIKITKKGQLDTPGTASGMNLAGNTLYLADGNSGLLVIDVSDRSAPAAIQTYPATGACCIVETAGKLFLADTIDGIAMYEKSDGSNFAKTGFFDPPSNTDALFADGNYAYLLDKNGSKEGLIIISLSYTGQYSFTGSVATPGNATNLQVTDSNAYVADGPAGVTIINIEDKTSPLVTGSFKPGGRANDIIVHACKNTAYIADMDFGLVLADITDQGLLSERVTLYIENARALAYFKQEIEDEQEKQYILVVNEEGLYTVDISNPADPVEAGYLKTPGRALDVGVKDHYAVVADGENGILLIDISDPANPLLSASHDTEGTAQALFMDQSYIHVADGTNGLQILGIAASDSVELKPITSYNTHGTSSDVFVSTSIDITASKIYNYTYVGDGKGGFLSFVHSDKKSDGIDEKPFPDSPDDSGWDRAEGGPSCFISTLF